MKRQCFLASAIFTSLAISAAANAAEGYVTDSRGAVVKSEHGLCWKTGYWTPGMAIAECDPDLAPRPQAAQKPPLQAASPAPAPAPAKAAGEDVSLAADTLFGFGRATLSRQGRAKLDELADRIQSRPVRQIVVVGHADRIGSKQINQRLSLKRAEAVKAYLVARKIDGSLIGVEGKGSSEPVTAPEQCRGKGRQLVACLAPDRRVVIRITRQD